MSFQIEKFIEQDGINIKNVEKREFKSSIDYYSSQTNHLTVCFKSDPLVECRRRIETKSTMLTKDLLKSCGLDTSR